MAEFFQFALVESGYPILEDRFVAISGIGGLSFGMVYQPGKPDQIVSDGKVEDRFVSQGEHFISDITDKRIQEFCRTGQAPSEAWKAHELGGFDSDKQSLFTEAGKVVLRSNGEDGKRHLIHAPFDPATGKVNLEASTEGFDTAPQPGGRTLHFEIPGASQIEFGGVINMDDPNAFQSIFK